MYTQYGRAVQGFPTPESEAYHAFINGATFLSAISYFFLLLESRKRQSIFVVMFATPFLLNSVWMNGKRAIVALIVVLVVYTLWKKNVLRLMNLLLVSVVCTGMMLVFSSLYQQAFRYDMLQIDDWDQVYHNMRVDMGRDDVTKMAIYAELYPDKLEILDYPFQSFLFTATMYVPREWWSDKPWPYAVYATSALLQIPSQYVGWSMTTGILDETIANVGWLGLLLGPLIISWIARMGDRNQTTIIQLLTVIVGSLMLVLQIAAFISIFLLWLVLVGWQVFKRKIRWSNLKSSYRQRNGCRIRIIKGGEIISRIVYAILAHNNQACLEDLIDSLHVFSPGNRVVLFNGGTDKAFAENLAVDHCPYSKPLKHGKLAIFNMV